MILRLGFRFQWIRINFIKGWVFDGIVIKPEDWLDDYIYDSFVNVMFFFKVPVA